MVVTPSASNPPPDLVSGLHVRVRLSARAPPLRERQDSSGGFLRSEVPHNEDLKVDAEPHEDDDEEEPAAELATLRGSFAWLLVRVQPRPTGCLSALRLQYQPFAACESFCLPIDHTNVRLHRSLYSKSPSADDAMQRLQILRVLVTDDVMRAVDSQLLVLRLLSPPTRSSPLEAASSPAVASPPSADSGCIMHPSSPLKEIVYDDEREAKAVARAVALVERDQEQRARQLVALKDAERASELAAAREAFASDRAHLEQEVMAAKAKSEQLEREREHLDRRMREKDEGKASEDKREDARLHAAASADEALEVRAMSSTPRRESQLSYSCVLIHRSSRVRVSCSGPSWRATPRSARSCSGGCTRCRRRSSRS